jgi:hypothetical protein
MGTPLKNIRVVVGYIPIPGQPRGPEVYAELGLKLKELKVQVHPFYETIKDTWMYQMVEALPFTPTVSVSDNPMKNSFYYHAVQHQKFLWLYKAMKHEANRNAKVFVYLDYGICHVSGVSPAVINDMLDRVSTADLCIPGCWPRGDINDEHPCWRFCGGLLVVPRRYVQPLKNLVQVVSMLHVRVTRNVTFEVNTLSRVEQTGKIPIKWYKADHDQSMFENYPG